MYCVRIEVVVLKLVLVVGKLMSLTTLFYVLPFGVINDDR